MYVYILQTVNIYDQFNTTFGKSENTDKIKSHPPQLCASSQCSTNPQTPRLVLGCGGGVSPLPRGTPADAMPAANPVIPGL